ncbi:MAG: ubiquinone biosynthesis regulatory protein kinase UbiB [Gammaproteobacteria bacterium]|nr:ubiquinone biosynthesis regulatory protein kinase UbiB [Gammaproteobacteria bacterium]MCP5199315.1 ubiquinone biosynthesis regulatory protein kinase UbiB [Gammaproteobacteria bacterium]
MIAPRQLLRVFTIQRVLVRHGFDELVFSIPLLRPARFLLYLLPWNWARRDYKPRAERIRAVLEDLGPLFVKFGQILSTRRDLLADDIAEELARLQDHVPPFPGSQARAIVEKAYGCPVSEAFAAFDEQPLASASIAQVHVARLPDGRDVIVKVVRPNIRRTIEQDISLMYIIADLAERYWARGKQLKPTVVVAEFEKTILDELDMMREAANASQLRRNFSDSDAMYVPEVYWDYTRQNVLVMERIVGIGISDVAGLVAAGVDLEELAARGVEIFFVQVFRDHFFHADVHPGNLFILPGDGDMPTRYAPVDFGIMGSLSEFDQRYLADNFSAFLNRDYRRVAELHVESGWVPADTRVDEFEFAIRAVCEPIFDRPMKDISVGNLLLRLFQTAQRFHMEILPQLLLLQKTLVNVEGIGRQLYPELDLWRAARPALENFMRERVGVRRLVSTFRDSVPRWADRLPELPGLAMEVLDQVKGGRIKVQTHDPTLESIRAELRILQRRLVFALVGVGLVICAAILFGMRAEETWMLGPLPFSVWLFGGLGLVATLFALRRGGN